MGWTSTALSDQIDGLPHQKKSLEFCVLLYWGLVLKHEKNKTWNQSTPFRVCYMTGIKITFNNSLDFRLQWFRAVVITNKGFWREKNFNNDSDAGRLVDLAFVEIPPWKEAETQQESKLSPPKITNFRFLPITS